MTDKIKEFERWQKETREEQERRDFMEDWACEEAEEIRRYIER